MVETWSGPDGGQSLRPSQKIMEILETAQSRGPTFKLLVGLAAVVSTVLILVSIITAFTTTSAQDSVPLSSHGLCVGYPFCVPIGAIAPSLLSAAVLEESPKPLKLESGQVHKVFVPVLWPVRRRAESTPLTSTYHDQYLNI